MCSMPWPYRVLCQHANVAVSVWWNYTTSEFSTIYCSQLHGSLSVGERPKFIMLPVSDYRWPDKQMSKKTSCPWNRGGSINDIDTDIAIIGTTDTDTDLIFKKTESIDYREKIIDVTIFFDFFCKCTCINSCLYYFKLFCSKFPNSTRCTFPDSL